MKQTIPLVLVELGAIYLTNKPGDTFTLEQLTAKVAEFQLAESQEVSANPEEVRALIELTGYIKEVRPGEFEIT